MNAPTGAATGDYDGDGVSNALEYVLGGTKTTNDRGKLPKIIPAAGGTNMLFTFQRTHASEAGSTLRVETSLDLIDWTTNPGYTIGAVSATPVKVTENGSVDDIEVTIPKNGARTFARLRVITTP